MTTYLRKKNRAVRLSSLRERAFEMLISNFPLLGSIAAMAGVIIVFSLFVLAGRIWLG